MQTLFVSLSRVIHHSFCNFQCQRFLFHEIHASSFLGLIFRHFLFPFLEVSWDIRDFLPGEDDTFPYGEFLTLEFLH